MKKRVRGSLLATYGERKSSQSNGLAGERDYSEERGVTAEAFVT